MGCGVPSPTTTSFSHFLLHWLSCDALSCHVLRAYTWSLGLSWVGLPWVYCGSIVGLLWVYCGCVLGVSWLPVSALRPRLARSLGGSHVARPIGPADPRHGQLWRGHCGGDQGQVGRCAQLSLSLSFSLPQSLSPTLSISLPLSLSLSLCVSFSLCVSLSFSLSVSVSLVGSRR